MIYGVGINDYEYPVKIKGKHIPEYLVWRSMISRCYNTNYHKSKNYENHTVCEEWLSFSNFKKWMDTKDWVGKQLDKDLLIENNLIYGTDTCVFISSALNKFITTKHNYRGECPLGVTRQNDGNNFVATVSVNSNNVYLGSFRTMYEAHCAWRNEKMKLLNEYIKNEKDPDVVRGLNRVYEKLKIEKLNNQETKRL